MYIQPSDVPPPRSRSASGSERVPPSPPSATSGSGSGGDRPPAYQSEERYWTDYLRIALPIAGLLLLLSVFWYWASSFIGGDDNPTQTPIVAVNVTPQNAPTLTPTLADAIQLTPQLPTATTAAVQPTQPVEQPTEAVAQPTQAAVEPTQPATTGKFAEGDLVIVNDNDVNMRSQPSTTGEIVDTLTQGTELRVLSGTPTEAEGYVWWNVSDDALGVSGWIAGDFIEK